MTRRHIHYEAAFEDYLRSRGMPYIPVDEAKKVIFSGEKIKSFDFLVYGKEGEKWLLDVKGRKFPYHVAGSKRYWENWVAQEDIDGLLQWKRAFGGGFSALFLFAYWLIEPDSRLPTADVHPFRDKLYAFLTIPVEVYQKHARVRSTKWRTLSLPLGKFRELITPVGELLQGS